MGTRHYQVVICKEGKKRIKQYGQWDGYPDGQGVAILRNLRAVDLKIYEDELSKIELITTSQEKTVNSHPNPKGEYPYLFRDCGSDIHLLIPQGLVEFVNHCSEEEAEKWCEGFYTVDFKERTFKSVFDKEKTYSLDDLPTDEVYLSEMEAQ